FTGHIRAMLRDGSVIEERRPHMRGGAHEPLARGEIEDKFLLNAKHGGWSEQRAAAALQLIAGLVDWPVGLSALRGCRLADLRHRHVEAVHHVTVIVTYPWTNVTD